ncbi:unnamed protein product [Schistosoma haematobium]|nr:unnamed protein product [Schistosoma haematobium]
MSSENALFNPLQTSSLSSPVFLLPHLSGTFERLVDTKDIDPKFLFTFYGSQVIKFRILITGRIEVYNQEYSGGIKNYVRNGFYVKTDISDGQELLAVRKSYYIEADNEIPVFKITTLIHPNGKISIYYENIPRMIAKTEKPSSIYGWFHCGEKDKKVSEINVPKIWIQNGTLVEWEPLGECSKHDSTEACPDPLTSSTTCIWCETVNMCITSNDKDLHEFKVNGCKNKILIANVPTEPTTLATTETDLRNELEKTSGSIESHLNMTKDTTTLTTTETDLINELKKTSGNTESHLNVTSDITEDIEKRKSLPYVVAVGLSQYDDHGKPGGVNMRWKVEKTC